MSMIDVNKVCSMLIISTTKAETVSLVEGLIAAAIEIAQSYCDRKFSKEIHRERFVGNNFDYVITANYPITQVISSPSPVVYFDKNEVVFASKISKGQAFILEYEAGFDELPADLELAIIELVGWRFKSLSHLDVTSNRDEKGSTVTYVRSELPQNVKMIFDKYRKKYWYE